MAVFLTSVVYVHILYYSLHAGEKTVLCTGRLTHRQTDRYTDRYIERRSTCFCLIW